MDDKVSIILLNYNGGEHTVTCLESLEQLNYPTDRLEIIVVDNASTDGSAEAIGQSFPHVKLIRSPENVGFSKGANLGASHASGGYLAFLNNDMKVDPEWLGPLVAAMADPSIGCAGSVIRSWDGATVEFGGRRSDAFAISYSAATDAPPAEEIASGYQLFVSGGAMLVRASLFRQAGGFDPGYFMYQEDIDLCWRLWLNGSSCMLVPDSGVFHRGGASSSRLSPQVVQGMSQANVLATLFKNLEDEAVRSSLPLVIVYLLMRSADQVEGIEGFERAMKVFRDALPELVERRKMVQSTRLRSDAKLWDLVEHPLSFLEGAGSFTKLLAVMMGDTVPEYSLEKAEGLQNLVGIWAERAADIIGTCGEVFAIEKGRQDRMRRLEIAARDSVIGQRDEGIVFLQQMLKTRETELTALREQLEVLSNRTRKYDSYVRLAELVAEVAEEFGVPNLSFDPRSTATSGQSELPAPISHGSRFDIICFSIIDWEFRWQRPQQLMSQFADHGHRVFYISIARILPVAGERFRVIPLRENVWEIQLALPMRVDVYGGNLSRELAMLVTEDLRALRDAFRISEAVSMIQVATWAGVAYQTRDLFGWPVVYDCMDEWDTFPGMANALLTAERRLIREADLVVVTAQKLLEKYRNANEHVILARNAADFERFYRAEPSDVLEDMPRPVVGYFGAIAEWFDLDLMVRIARERPKYSFVLIGGVFGLDMRDLEDLSNVYILGQQPYETMPSYLRGFDACIIPFKVNAVTEATDPVKFYEFISQGKAVVSTTMPELYPYDELLYIARDQEDFLQKLDLALRENDDTLVEQRIELARANAWPARYEAIRSAISAVVPKVSIIIVTFHNLDFTRQCIDSVMGNTLHPDFEIIIVDNASADGTRDYLLELEEKHDNVRVILNDENAGFARANNQGLSVATGEYLVLLNNDTVVPRGWLNGLIRHLRDPEIGLVNSVTNFSGNESRIEVPYTDIDGMEDFAARYMAAHFDEIFDIRVAAMYCVAMRREVYERVGPLDEAFGVGMFEDDDYSHRMRLASYRVVCAEDAFVHHFGQASFKKLDPETYQKIWDANQTHFQTKWNMPWKAHTARRPEHKRSRQPERAALEILFAKLARQRELSEAQMEKASEVADFQGRIAASKERIDMLEHLLHVTKNELHSIQELKVLKLAGVYWRAMSFLRGRRPDGSPALTTESFAPLVESAPPLPAESAVDAAQTPAVVDVIPKVPAAEPVARIDRLDTDRPVVYDVICFPIIDWDFRLQRPQQMMLQFASAGHRVFYVSHQIRLKGDACEVRQVAERVFEVSLRGSPRDVYVQSMTRKDAALLEEGIRVLRTEYGISEAASIVQLPFWAPLVLRLNSEYGWPVIYDMMDNMAAFATSPKSILEVEEQLLTSADLVVVTSTSLERQAEAKSSNVALIRNGVDYEHFAKISTASPFHTHGGRPLIGYYGAIADWFDVDLVAELARRHPEWDFVLVGSTVSSNVKRLRKLRNMSLAGERPYADLPMWLERFDVAIIPFRITPLTEATNPVKAYEMLAGGKPVVSVPMPEVAAMAPLIRLASTVEEFETQILQAIEFDYEPWIVEKRRAFARQNTWHRRQETFDVRIRETYGKVLIVMDVPERKRSVLRDLNEILGLTLWPNLEVVVLTSDTFLARSDELAARLREQKRNVRLEALSGEAFSQAANRLFSGSDADYLVILPFGVELHEGWLNRLIRHLDRDEGIGVLMPEIVANDIEADALADRIEENDGKIVEDGGESPVVILRREMVDRIGPLGEDLRSAQAAARSYGRQARTSMLRVVRARDVLVRFEGESRSVQTEETT